jgi:hypothetical protein
MNVMADEHSRWTDPAVPHARTTVGRPRFGHKGIGLRALAAHLVDRHRPILAPPAYGDACSRTHVRVRLERLSPGQNARCLTVVHDVARRVYLPSRWVGAPPEPYGYLTVCGDVLAHSHAVLTGMRRRCPGCYADSEHEKRPDTGGCNPRRGRSR